MTGRPQKSEAAPPYFTYINRVIGEDATVVLRDQMEDSLAFFSGISEEASLYRYAAEKWSFRQTLNHITDTERVFAFRALWFARELDAPLPGYDQNIATANAGADAVPWAVQIEEFRSVRRSTISLFTNMPPDAWSRSGIADGNPFTVRAVAFIIAGHLAHHVAILRERYSARLA